MINSGFINPTQSVPSTVSNRQRGIIILTNNNNVYKVVSARRLLNGVKDAKRKHAGLDIFYYTDPTFSVRDIEHISKALSSIIQHDNPKQKPHHISYAYMVKDALERGTIL